jgi:hypothetical protein
MMVILIMYDEGDVLTLYVPQEFADLPLYILKERGLIFMEVYK